MARHNLGKKIDANGTLNDLGNTVSDDDLTKIDNLDNTYLPLTGGTLKYQAQIKAGTSVFKDLLIESEGFRILNPTKEDTTSTKIATINSTGNIRYRTPDEIKSDMGVEIGAAGKLGVDTTIGDSPTNAKLPTSLAVANYLESKGLVTPSDLENTYMKKASPTGTGSLSLNRKANTTVGTNSVALGLNPTASGMYSFSEGIDTVASGFSSFAQGDGSQAQGSSSAAIGLDAIAKGDCSQAIGYGVESTHLGQHVFGAFNVLDTSTASKSSQGTYIEIVGNGNKVLSTGAITRSNARTLDWSGNEVLAGTLTTGGEIYEGGTALSSKYLGINANAASATKATQDGSGNNIANTYATKSALSDVDAKILTTPVSYASQSLTTAQKTQARTNIGAGTSSFSGSYNDLTNKPTLFSGNYNDLTNKPTIPSVNDGNLIIRVNNTETARFTANQSGNVFADFTIPSTSSFVTKTGNETISGEKTHSANINLDNEKYLYSKNSSGTSKRLIGLASNNNLLLGDTATSIIVNSGIRPSTNYSGAVDLGLSTNLWGNIYFSGSLHDGTNSVKVSQIATKTEFLSKIYPVGSVYMSVNNTSPASFLGGTWERIQDRFLLGAGSSYSAGATGGSATHTLTVNEMPKHSHQVSTNISSSQSSSRDQLSYSSWDNSWSWTNYLTSDTGGGAAHNNMPPYLVVYMWKRTA